VITEASIKLAPIPPITHTSAIPLQRIEQGVQLGNRILGSSLIASSVLLFHKVEDPNWRAKDILLYSLQGTREDVIAETAIVDQMIHDFGIDEAIPIDDMGTSLWANWIQKHSSNHILYRLGIPTKEINVLLSSPIAASLDNMEYIYDLPHGLIYAKAVTEIAPLRREISNLSGYSMVLNPTALPESDFDRWGYQPESIEMMRAIKAKWDPKNLFNRDAFIL
jgi:FAD/FMN-containing dehydrogenase